MQNLSNLRGTYSNVKIHSSLKRSKKEDYKEEKEPKIVTIRKLYFVLRCYKMEILTYKVNLFDLIRKDSNKKKSLRNYD